MKFFPTLLLAATLWQPVSAEPSVELIKQPPDSNECGPSSFVNSLLLSSGGQGTLARLQGGSPQEKAREFARRFGQVDSVVYGKHRTAYSEKKGTTDQDLLAMINAMRKEQNAAPLQGQSLERREDEDAAKFLQRIATTVQQSVAAGFPPLLSVRSVKANADAKGKFQWNAITGHWVCITRATMLPTQDGLMLEIADSNSGRMIGGMMLCGLPRTSVPLRFRADEKGKEVWEWVDGGKCLFLSAPSLLLGTDKAMWHERTYIAARYLIWSAP